MRGRMPSANWRISMSVRYYEDSRTWVLDTVNSSYVIRADETGVLRHLFYGGRIEGCIPDHLRRDIDRGFSGNIYGYSDNRGYSPDTIPQEYSGHGAGDQRISSLIAETSSGIRSTDLRYQSYSITRGKYTLEGLPYVRECDDADTLIITLMDAAAGLTVELLYGVFYSSDVITRSVRITNVSEGPIILHKAASMCIDMSFGSWDLIHFHGRHCMERQPERINVPGGIFTVSSNRGMSSHHHNPFIVLCSNDSNEDSGDCYGMMLMYSGSHRIETEKDQTGSVRVVAGIDPEDFSWQLDSGSCFTCPETILTYSASGLGQMSRNLHRIIRENVIEPRYMTEKRPVLINSWEACYFDFDDAKIDGLARSASDLGIDMLVLDDGWFGARNNDRAGLGDWYVNTDKLQCGLDALAQSINRYGLKFGLWIEPEMVNEDSDLFRSHPDWAITEPGRKPVVARDQLVLDITREDVRDYIYDRICDILGSAHIEYIKWDMNRGLNNMYSSALPPHRQGEVSHRYVLGVYDLLSRIRAKFPDVLIEGCAGGGGRFDAGMLFYCPQIWCSDNTDPISRLIIQEGTSYGYPVSAMGSHVSASPNHQTGRSTPITTRAAVAMEGTFGYELDPAGLSREEREEIRREIRIYKRLYDLINYGDHYRLALSGSIEGTCWSAVSKDRKECLVTAVLTDVHGNQPVVHSRLKGLEGSASYRIEVLTPDSDPVCSSQDRNDMILSGSALMNAGLIFDMPLGDYPAIQILLTAAE